MASLNFPDTSGSPPTDGSFTHTENGLTYFWDGVKWNLETAQGSGGGGGPDYVLPTATAVRLGGVKVGDNLTVEPDGTLNVGVDTLQEVTDAGKHTTNDILIGNTEGSPNITLDANGSAAFSGKITSASTENGDDATTLATKDYVDANSGSDYTLPVATDSVLGGIKVGARLTITDGVLSADNQGGGGTSVGSLQEVTDVGNTTDNDLRTSASVFSGDNPVAGANAGARLINTGNLTISRDDSSSPAIAIHTTGETNPNFTLNADGLGEFSGGVEVTGAGIDVWRNIGKDQGIHFESGGNNVISSVSSDDNKKDLILQNTKKDIVFETSDGGNFNFGGSLTRFESDRIEFIGDNSAVGGAIDTNATFTVKPVDTNDIGILSAWSGRLGLYSQLSGGASYSNTQVIFNNNDISSNCTSTFDNDTEVIGYSASFDLNQDGLTVGDETEAIGFYSNVTGKTGHTYNFYAANTAPNFFKGDTHIGGLISAPNITLAADGSISTAKIRLNNDGSAVFVGSIQTTAGSVFAGQNPVNGARDGTRLSHTGNVTVSGSTPGNAIFAGYTTTGPDSPSDATSRINADGSAGFASGSILFNNQGVGQFGKRADEIDSRISIGADTTGDRNSYIDLISYSDHNDSYSTRILRSKGEDGRSEILHKGTGSFTLNAVDAGSISFRTSNTERVYVTSDGNFILGDRNNPGFEEKITLNAAGQIDCKGINSVGTNDATSGSVNESLFDQNFKSGDAFVSVGQCDLLPCIQGHGTNTAFHLHLNPREGDVYIGENRAIELRKDGKGLFSSNTRFSGGVTAQAITMPDNTPLDISSGNFWEIAGGITIANPSGISILGGWQSGLFILFGAPLAWGDAYKFPGGTPPALTSYPAVLPYYVRAVDQVFVGSPVEGLV